MSGWAVPELQAVIDTIKTVYPDFGEKARKEKGYAGFGSTIFAVKPGDGSAREQAASCQKVLGGWANIANEYATKRYRSNLINWGMLPFIIGKGDFHLKIWIISLFRKSEKLLRTSSLKSRLTQ